MRAEVGPKRPFTPKAVVYNLLTLESSVAGGPSLAKSTLGSLLWGGLHSKNQSSYSHCNIGYLLMLLLIVLLRSCSYISEGLDVTLEKGLTPTAQRWRQACVAVYCRVSILISDHSDSDGGLETDLETTFYWSRSRQ